MNHRIYSFDELRQLFVQYSRKNVIKSEPEGLYGPVNYIMGLQGKRIRPVICLMVANIYIKNPEAALPLAYSIEMFHNFTLVHDDIMDKADVRRSHPTVHVKFGHNSAILSGDLMMIKSYEHLINCCTDQDLKFRLLELFTETAIKVCEGQQYDMEFETSEGVNLEDYMKMIELKTAVLLGGAFKSGALIGRSSKKDANNFYDYGLNLGLAFQIQDDYLDVYGDPDVFGKKKGGDIIQKKKTFLYLKALELTDDKLKLEQLYNSSAISGSDKVMKILKIYDSLNLREITENTIKELTSKAELHLNNIAAPGKNLDVIRQLQKKLMERKS
ncbi:MAG: polyprenyl synthetase family protein [Deltaproteobacteria bacterium]